MQSLQWFWQACCVQSIFTDCHLWYAIYGCTSQIWLCVYAVHNALLSQQKQLTTAPTLPASMVAHVIIGTLLIPVTASGAGMAPTVNTVSYLWGFSGFKYCLFLEVRQLYSCRRTSAFSTCYHWIRTTKYFYKPLPRCHIEMCSEWQPTAYNSLVQRWEEDYRRGLTTASDSGGRAFWQRSVPLHSNKHTGDCLLWFSSHQHQWYIVSFIAPHQ